MFVFQPCKSFSAERPSENRYWLYKIQNMKKANIALILLNEIRKRLSSVFQVLKYLLHGQKEVISSIEIHGDREFCEVVKEALLLLKGKDPSSFTLADQHLNLIIQSGETLLSPSKWGIALSLEERETKSVSQTWLAYEGFRAKLAHDYLAQHGRLGKVPQIVYSGEKAWDFMYDSLKKIGGSYEELQHLADFIKKEQEKIAENRESKLR